MNIGIIIGSHRKTSQSAKVGRFLSTLLETEFGAQTWIRDLGTTPLPLWDEDIWNDGPQWEPLKALKCAADRERWGHHRRAGVAWHGPRGHQKLLFVRWHAGTGA